MDDIQDVSIRTVGRKVDLLAPGGEHSDPLWLRAYEVELNTKEKSAEINTYSLCCVCYYLCVKFSRTSRRSATSSSCQVIRWRSVCGK